MRISAFLGVVVLALFAACGGGGSSGGDDQDDPSDNPAIDAAIVNGSCLGCGDGTDTACCDIGGQAFCVSTADDFLNCGGCGMACDETIADSCGGSDCKCGAAPACAAGSTCCGAPTGCKDLQNDPQNCGLCGKTCGPDQTCSNGECTCGGTTCNPDQTCCGGTCVDTNSDAANCGMCGKQCTGTMNACNAGECGCAGGAECPTMSMNPFSPKVVPMCCGTGCADICNDKNNCGGCGVVCPGANEGCFQGGCFDTGAPIQACNPFAP